LGQSEFCAQATQRCSTQIGVDVLAQSELPRHSTQLSDAALQRGFGAEHCESVVQPARHWKPSGSHTGIALPQSELAKQSTHRSSLTRQRGALAGQSAFFSHATHWWVVVSQIGVPPEQSPGRLHPTQAPLWVTQSGAKSGQDVAEVHGA
jgi:hypothetical protein